jgi:hypothetical protein
LTRCSSFHRTVDSFIEVISAVAPLWRLRKAGPHASAEERGTAERRALYLVASLSTNLLTAEASARRLSERFSERVGGFVAHVGERVRVSVESDRDAGVCG